MGLPTIGFTVPWGTDNSYVGPIWQGVIEACRERGANLLSFTGPRQLSDVFLMFPQYGFQMNSSNVDAMIVVCASAALVRNMAGYGEFPVITISDPNSECPSLVSDNEAGIGATIDHLVLDHGYRRIAFIRGPAHDSAAAARYGSYREALARHGIPFDEDLVFPGSYDRASGREAARLLLERGTECRAIVASNDLCALGAISALAEAGVGVPEDIAVTGFDDSDEAAFCIPPLASVRQPQRGMGRRAVEMALARLRGEAVPMVEALPTEFVPRRSCGCFSAQVRGAARPGAAAQARQAMDRQYAFIPGRTSGTPASANQRTAPP
jgi:DNA-binding LacI/PurR family transcriptional regulator